MASLEEIRNERKKKLDILIAAKVDPYPIKTARTKEIVSVVTGFSKLVKSKKSLVIAGRVLSKRGQGGLVFIDLNDGTDKIQALFKRDELIAKDFTLFEETVDLGDIIEVRGGLFLTKRGEKSILVKKWTMLAKSLRPLPDKWHGLADVEERFRRRYLDSLMSAEVKERFIIRSKTITALRANLDKANFLEVETPMLQPVPGGATAKPFITRHNTLGLDLFLRVSPELYLKQMLVGGFTKIYEVSRNFRNEGIDQTHNPEFTMLEFYQAYSWASDQQKFVEKLLTQVIKNVLGQTTITYDNNQIDFSTPFKRVSYFDLLKRYALIQDPETISDDKLLLKTKQLGVKVGKGDSREKILDNIYKKTCRPKLIQPTFVEDYPVDYLPLAKRLADKPEVVDAFQLVVAGIELVKAFSELNDPLDQRERFASQEKMRQAGDEEAQLKDEAFLEALEYGMPPAGGVGIGIDRLVMLLTDTSNIKEVIFFPTMRRKE